VAAQDKLLPKVVVAVLLVLEEHWDIPEDVAVMLAVLDIQAQVVAVVELQQSEKTVQ
jgi:hypothetical protein